MELEQICKMAARSRMFGYIISHSEIRRSLPPLPSRTIRQPGSRVPFLLVCIYSSLSLIKAKHAVPLGLANSSTVYEFCVNYFTLFASSLLIATCDMNWCPGGIDSLRSGLCPNASHCPSPLRSVEPLCSIASLTRGSRPSR